MPDGFDFFGFLFALSPRRPKTVQRSISSQILKYPPMLHFRDMPRICVEKKYRDRIKNGLPCYVSKTKSVHSFFKLMIRSC